MSLIGLDIGTTGCKALAFDETGKRLAGAYREYARAGEGIHELDPEEVWRAVCEVLRGASAACAGDAPAALSVSSFGEAAIPLDGRGRALHASLLYTDPRGAAQCARLAETPGEGFIMAHAGVKPHPMYSVCKIGWYRDELPEVFGRVWRWMLFEDYILWRLGAEPAIDYSLASRTMAFNVSLLSWDGAILDACGLRADRLSRPVPPGTAVGRISESAAGELGLPRGMLLVAGAHDQVCAAVGAGVLRPGMAIDGTGTVECIAPVFSGPVLDERFLGRNFACVPYALPGAYTTYAFNFTGGSLLRWFRDGFARARAAEAARAGMSVYDLLNAGAAGEPTDLLVIPHFAGSGTPDMDTLARGAILGLRFEHGAGAVYRALMEGVTYEMAYNLEALAAVGIRVTELRAVGGGAKSALWLRIKAGVTGCPIVPLEVEEAGAAGAAMLAGTAAGVFSTLGEAAEAFVRVGAAVEPDPGDRAVYAGNYARYKEARGRLSGLYGRDMT